MCRRGSPGALPGLWMRRDVTFCHVPCPRVPLTAWHGNACSWASLWGWAGGGGSGERGQLLSPCRMWGRDPGRLGQRLSSDAILWRGRRSPPLPEAMASLHVLCSLPCLRVSVDLWPLQSSLTAAQLLAQTPARLRALAPGQPRQGEFWGGIQAPHAVGSPCI